MKTKIFLFLTVFLLAQNVHSQEVEDNEEIRNMLNQMFDHLDKKRVPHGLLRDYAFELVDLDQYKGQINDSNYINRTIYENILRTVKSSSVKEPPYSSVDEILKAQYEIGKAKENLGVIGLAMFEYSQIREDALTAKLIKYEKEQVYDNFINGVWQNPYETRHVLAFALQDTLLYGNYVEYSFPDKLWKTNLGITSIEFDAGDGSGYKSAKKGAIRNVKYATGGIKHLKIRVKKPDGAWMYSHSQVKIISDAVLTRAEENEFWVDKERDIQVNVSGGTVKGRMSYLYAYNTPGRVVRPLIIMEGFDPIEFAPHKTSQSFHKEKKLGSTNIKTFINSINIYALGHLNTLRRDYDIIYIDLFNCTNRIQENAALFQEAVRIINSEKEQVGERQKNIVIGQSMGGLIARYGLKKMEERKERHETSTLIFHDTPHLGANVPIGLLHVANGVLQFYKKKLLLNAIDIGDAKANIKRILHSPAARQMLINYVTPSGDIDNSVHNAWQKELKELGYPRGDAGESIRIAGISNGQDVVPIMEGDVGKKYYFRINGHMGLSALSDFLYTGSMFLKIGVAPFVQDWQFFFMSLMPGRSLFEVNVEANEFGSQNICDMYLRYKKKLLWLKTIRRTIFRYTKPTPANMINFEKAYGSYYFNNKKDEMKEPNKLWKILLDNKIDIKYRKAFLFIPTASALDIGKGKVQLIESDYRAVYDRQSPPKEPKNIPFDDFYITQKSTMHISFNYEMWDWILEQMQIRIAGPAHVPSGKSKFSIQNSLKSYTVKWITSDESVATIDDMGMLTAKKYGVITLTANCILNGKVVTRVQKEIMIGFPPFVLDEKIKDGDVLIKARCIAPEAIPFLKEINYDWKIKYITSTQPTQWEEKGDSIMIEKKDQQSKCTIYMRPIGRGEKGKVQFVKIDVTKPFKINRNFVRINATNENLYRELPEISFERNPFADFDFNSENFKIACIVSFVPPRTPDEMFSPDGGKDFSPSLITKGSMSVSECFWDFEKWVNQIKYTGEQYAEIITILYFVNSADKIIQKEYLMIEHTRDIYPY